MALQLKGRGDYTAENPSKWGKLLRLIGSGAGYALGGPGGALTGHKTASFVSRLMGQGDYAMQGGGLAERMKRNSIMAGTAVPTFKEAGHGIRVCHREYIADIDGSTAFTNTSYAINPGLQTSFPWLSTLAALFEEYEFNGLVYEYKTTSGTYAGSSSAALGSVLMACEYDALDTSYSSKQQMEVAEFATSTPPFQNCLSPIECDPKLNVFNKHFVRSAPVPSTADKRLYDVGNFQIATVGMASAYPIGELWVTYDVTFRKPQMYNGVPQLYTHITGLNPSAAAPLGTAPTIDVAGYAAPYALGTTYVSCDVPGTYFVAYGCTTNVGITAVPTITAGTNWTTTLAPLQNNTANAIASDTSTAASIFGFYTLIAAGTGSSQRLTFALPGATGVGSNADLIILYLSPQIGFTSADF